MAGQVSARAVAAAAGKSYWREADARRVVEAWERSGQPLSGFGNDRRLDLVLKALRDRVLDTLHLLPESWAWTNDDAFGMRTPTGRRAPL